jgi:hypothetical protein
MRLVGVRKGATLDAVKGSHNWGSTGLRASAQDIKGLGMRFGDLQPFLAPQKGDYRLAAAIVNIVNAGLPLEKISIPATPGAREKGWTPKVYRHPAAEGLRRVVGLPDLGAYELQPSPQR